MRSCLSAPLPRFAGANERALRRLRSATCCDPRFRRGVDERMDRVSRESRSRLCGSRLCFLTRNTSRLCWTLQKQHLSRAWSMWSAVRRWLDALVCNVYSYKYYSIRVVSHTVGSPYSNNSMVPTSSLFPTSSKIKLFYSNDFIRSTQASACRTNKKYVRI